MEGGVPSSSCDFLVPEGRVSDAEWPGDVSHAGYAGVRGHANATGTVITTGLPREPFRGVFPGQKVSEGGLEPPCPIRALAPQASASAYSATRTRDARGTHRLSHLSKPNAPRRVRRPVNLATRCRSSRRLSNALPVPGTTAAPSYGMDAAFMSLQHDAAQLNVDHWRGVGAGSRITSGARALSAHSRDRRSRAAPAARVPPGRAAYRPVLRPGPRRSRPGVPGPRQLTPVQR